MSLVARRVVSAEPRCGLCRSHGATPDRRCDRCGVVVHADCQDELSFARPGCVSPGCVGRWVVAAAGARASVGTAVRVALGPVTEVPRVALDPVTEAPHVALDPPVEVPFYASGWWPEVMVMSVCAYLVAAAWGLFPDGLLTLPLKLVLFVSFLLGCGMFLGVVAWVCLLPLRACLAVGRAIAAWSRRAK